MHDILPEDQKYFQKIYHLANDLTNFYGFEKIETQQTIRISSGKFCRFGNLESPLWLFH